MLLEINIKLGKKKNPICYTSQSKEVSSVWVHPSEIQQVLDESLMINNACFCSEMAFRNLKFHLNGWLCLLKSENSVYPLIIS